MTSLIALTAGFSPAAESAPALPSDAQAPLDGLAEQVFMQLDPQLQPLPEVLEAALREEPEPVSEDLAVDPQQWLIAMLDQQAVQVQARGLTDAGSAEAGAERVLSRLPLQARIVVLGDESPDPIALCKPAQQTWHGVQAALAQPAERNAAGLVVALPHAGPALLTLGTAPAADDLTPLPATLAAQEPVLERGLKLAAPQARWGEQMLHALRETVQVQVQQRFQQATIRLDPPELGSLEIFITQEPGRLSVQISAAQGDVARLLLHTSDRLRQELVEQNTLQVNVQISSDSQGHAERDSSRHRQEPEIAEAVQEAQGMPHSRKHRTSDVLVTV
ncbi:hypothetical protein PS910_00506 [Pseudomonas fluorescens]|nr:hypothetical protein PS910_00506 [Pseudomonas fluorescens]